MFTARSEPLFSEFDNLTFSGSKSQHKPDTSTNSTYRQLKVNGLHDLGDLHDKRVFLRVDLNVNPSDKNFARHPRVISSYKSIRSLIDIGAKLVVTSHLSGKDRVSKQDQSATFKICKALIEAFPDLREHVNFVGFDKKECQSAKPSKYRYLKRVCELNKKALPGSVLFTENPRLFDFEDDDKFLKKRIELEIKGQLLTEFDFAIHDCFGGSHRTQFTTNSLFRHFPFNRKALGPSSCEEWNNKLSFTLNAEPGSVALILGGDGGKFSTKVRSLDELLKDNDKIGAVYLGGIFALAYLHSTGSTFGKTPLNILEDDLKNLLEVISRYKAKVTFRLPTRLKGLDSNKQYAEWKILGSKLNKRINIPDGAIVLDQRRAGLSTLFAKTKISRVAIFGPLGFYSMPQFAKGTQGTVSNIHRWAKADQERKILIGGGNTLEAISDLFSQIQLPGQFFVSTGGGAGMKAFASILNTKDGRDISHPALNALRHSPATS